VAIITSIIAYGVTGQVGAALMIGGIGFYQIFVYYFHERIYLLALK